MCNEYGVLQMALLYTYVAFSAEIGIFLRTLNFPGFPGNSREIDVPGKCFPGN